jgi:hypothetical protein
MLSKCAHPTCFAQFRYLRAGRVFKVRMPGSASSGATHHIEHFWLCEHCARSLTIVFEKGRIITRPLYLELTAGKPETLPDANDTRKIA